MAWSDEDQNPSMVPAGTNYAAGLSAPSYMMAVSSSSSAAPARSATTGETDYASRLAAGTAQPFETRETSRALATSADRTAAARRYTSEVSTKRGGTMQRQGERSLDLLHPQYVQRFAKAARRAHAEGIPVGIYSAYRPPAMGVGGFGDKYKSTHAYGIGGDVQGIGRAGSEASRRWYEIATEEGLFNPYGPNNRKEWNHYQLVPEKSAYQIPGLRDTITGSGPDDPEAMWAASGIDPDGVPYAGDPFGVSRTKVAAASPPAPRSNPRGQPRMGAQGARDTATAYAPQPERAQAPFDAVVNERPAARPVPAQATQRGTYTVQRGDSLSRIAQRVLGDPNRWREIAAANNLRDPNMIRPGQQLRVPGSEGPAARQEAAAGVPTPRPRPSREVAMPTPRQRPERGADVPNPPSNPRRVSGAPPDQTRAYRDFIDSEVYRNFDGSPPSGQNLLQSEDDVRRSVQTFRDDLIGQGIPEGPRLDSAVRDYEAGIRRKSGVQPVMDAAEIGRRVSEFRAGLLRDGVPPGPRLDDAVNQFAAGLRQRVSGVQPSATRGEPPRVGTVEAGSTGGEHFTPASPMPSEASAMENKMGRFADAFAGTGGPGMIMDMQPTFVSRNGARIWAAR